MKNERDPGGNPRLRKRPEIYHKTLNQSTTNRAVVNKKKKKREPYGQTIPPLPIDTF